MNSKFLALFQIGPVQEFINTARKTQDFWSGSFLLPYLCAMAMAKVVQETGGKSDVIIFPDISDNPLYDQAQKPLPWTSSTAPKAEALRPTVPNRFMALFSEQDSPKTILEASATRVIEQWKEVARIVKSKLESQIPSLGTDPTFCSIWQRQIPRVFEILYVWHPWDGTDTSYGKTYRETEVLFGARKATRWFETDEAEAGHKCSLCGSRQALHLSTTGPNRSDIREFWKDGLKLKLNRDIQYRFKEGEHLCAVCTVKRLAPEWVFGKILDIPSTSSVAVSEFIKRIGDKVAQLGGRLISKFSQDVEDLASLVGEPKKVDPMPLLEKEYRDALPSLIHLDGDWFYEDTYESLRAKIKDFVHLQGNSAPVINAQESLEEVVNALRSLEGDTFRPPTKYFCILSADGDSMGRVLANVSSLQNHRDLSGRLASFAGASVVQLLQDDHLGYVVYFGGDEGVAFVALEDLFKVMKALRDVWEEQVMRPLQSVLSSPPTLSVGAVIAHHQHGLRFSLREARTALDYAKDMKGKDAFGVTILRRSGSPSQTRAKWRYLSPSIEVLEVLAAHQDAYRKEILSPRWLNDLRGEALAICGRLPHDYSEAKELCDYEIKRLIRRHWTDPNGLPPDNLIAQTVRLHEAIWGPVGRPNQRGFEDFVGLMDLAFYVARGGGY